MKTPKNINLGVCGIENAKYRIADLLIDQFIGRFEKRALPIFGMPKLKDGKEKLTLSVSGLAFRLAVPNADLD